MAETILENIDESMYEFIFLDKLNLIRLSKPHRIEDSNEETYSFPESKGIIIKTRFVEDEASSRRFPNKTYYEYDPLTFTTDLENTNKRSLSSKVKGYLIDYIKSNQSLNNYFLLTEKSIVKKSNAVKYEMKFSDYVDFNIVIEPKDLEVDDVSQYITGLPIEKLKEEKFIKTESGIISSDPWKVELAKSSRASCRTCGEKIEKQTIRIGQPSYYQDHLSYKWHHLACIKSFDEGNTLIGLDELDDDEKERVNAKLFSKQDTTSKSPKDIILDIIVDYEGSDGLTAESDIYKKGKDYNLQNEDIKKILLEMEEEGSLYRPDQGKIKLI